MRTSYVVLSWRSRYRPPRAEEIVNRRSAHPPACARSDTARSASGVHRQSIERYTGLPVPVPLPPVAPPARPVPGGSRARKPKYAPQSVLHSPWRAQSRELRWKKGARPERTAWESVNTNLLSELPSPARAGRECLSAGARRVARAGPGRGSAVPTNSTRAYRCAGWCCGRPQRARGRACGILTPQRAERRRLREGAPGEAPGKHGQSRSD